VQSDAQVNKGLVTGEYGRHFEQLPAEACEQACCGIDYSIAMAGRLALQRMTEHYGGGYPEYAPGNEVSFAAHNGLHGREVGVASERMGTELGLRSPYLLLARATGEAHDAILTDGGGVKLQRGEMEDQTAIFFGKLLRAQGVDEELVAAGELGVLGTKNVLSDEGLLIGQVVSTMNFPSKSAEDMAMSVACADMAGAYSRRGPLNCLEYYKELRGIQAHEAAAFESGELAGHYRYEQRFLEAYAFPHPVGETLFGKDRARLNDFYQQTADALQAGAIESWAQLQEHAEAYARA